MLALHHHRAQPQPGHNPITYRKILRRRRRAQRKLRHDRAALFHLRIQLAILFRILNVDPCAQHSDHAAVRRRARSAQRRSVDPARQSARDHQSARRQIAPQPLGHLIAVRRGPARPDDGDHVPIEHARIAGQIK